jgi:hypothetical protein
MRALGEDPERYAALQRELSTAYGPGDALWDQQLADLGKLYWRRNRIERMETGLMRRALRAVEERQRERLKQIAAATFDASSFLATDPKLAVPAEPCARLRQQLSRLTGIYEQLRQGIVTARQQFTIANFLGTVPGQRPARIDQLMLMFSNRACCLAANDKERLKQRVNEMGGEANVEVLWRELLRLLEEEIAAVKAAFEEEVGMQEELDAIERDCCLAPAGETWEMLLRQEAALDRSIDRKVRIILTMRQEHARGRAVREPPLRFRRPALLPMNHQGLAQTRRPVSAIRGRMVKCSLPFGKRRPQTAGVCASRGFEFVSKLNSLFSITYWLRSYYFLSIRSPCFPRRPDLASFPRVSPVSGSRLRQCVHKMTTIVGYHISLDLSSG